MSYNSGSGYHSRSAGQPSQNYGTGRESLDNSSLYANQVRANDNRQQPQYSSSTYNWTGQSQPGTQTNTQTSYGNGKNWRDQQAVSYDYQRQNDLYIQSDPATTNAPTYSNATRDSYGQSTQGLNHLAYASGLEPTSARAPSNNRTNVAQQTNYASTSSVQSSVAPSRVKSPVGNTSYTVQPPVSQAMRQERSISSTSSPNMAVNAAAALAQAVSNRYPNTNQQVNQRVTSPAMATVQARSSIQRTDSLYTTNPMVNATNRSVLQETQPARTVVVTPQPPRSGPHRNERRSPQSQPQKPMQNSAQHTNSIANLVSAVDEAEEETYESNENHNSMPNFIDPTQVFNPYHREHERKKREAAEAEAKRIAEEKRQAGETRKSDEATNRREKEAVANSKSKMKKKPMPPAQKNPEANQVMPNATEKESMAAEMKAFMDRMKEFRSKDPAAFSQILNDMRGKDNSSQATATVDNLVSPQVSQATFPAVPTATVAAAPETPVPVAVPRSRKAGPIIPANIPPGTPLNGYRVVIDDNPEGLPDLGKYPALRRIRGSYSKNDASAANETSVAPVYPIVNEMPVPIPISATVPPTSNSNQAWPEPRRRAAATAAIKLLKSMPENAQNPITAEDIASMLERNPSYLDLCSALELRGLQFQKNTFAKGLLQSVPDLNSHSSEQGQQDNVIAHNDSLAKQWTATPAERPVAKTGFVGVAAVTPLSVKSESADAKVKQARIKTSDLISHQEPPPGTKEAAARKRDFSELVDLTRLSDNEDYVMPSKRQRTAMDEEDLLNNFAHPRRPQVLSSSVPIGFNTISASITPLRFDTQARGQAPTAPASQPTAFLQPTLVSTPPAPKQKNRMIIAKHMDKSEALQKSYYDPKTVARDVLIASGRHPSERPLNAHLAGMLGQYIELDSDLSTFDWDAIDPGGPPARKVDYINIPTKRPKFKLKDQSTLLSSMQPPLQDQATPMPKEVRRNPASRSPVPPTVATPDLTKPSKLRHTTAIQEHIASNSVTATSPHRRISVNIPIDRYSRRPIPHSTTDSPSQASAMEMEIDPPIKRRIGRPPGAKNKTPSVAALKKQASNIRVSLPMQPQPAQSQPAADHEIMAPVHPEYRCRWIKCQARLHNLATLRRHVPKRHVPTPKEANETGYLCWWKHCPLFIKDDDGIVPSKAFDSEAEWMAHIEENHVQPLGRTYGDGPSTINTGKQQLDLNKFIYNCPVGPLARTVSYTDSQRAQTGRDRYLTDESGRFTTPAIALDGSPTLPNDALELTRVYPSGPRTEKEKADATAQNAYMKAHGSKTTDQRRRAVETVRAMAARKEKIGPGIDRGGCTLINEERRSTFVQNPGLVRIIEAEY